jgi:hypothetical protein
MAEPREDLQSEGRRENAAQPLDAAEGGKPERYPPTGADDAVKGEAGKSFEPRVRNETAPDDARFGKGVDPAEGKR